MILYGASGHAKVIREILKSINVGVEYLVDDNPDITNLSGLPVKHEIADGKLPLIISVGNNSIRKMLAERIKNPFGTAIARSAIVAEHTAIGEGSVVMQGTVIQPEARIGKHCIVNTGASVDHECTIGDFVHIAPHATLCGNVRVGEGTLIGVGASVIPGVKIGKWCVIGAGAAVTQDVPDHSVAVGVPAKIIKQTE